MLLFCLSCLYFVTWHGKICQIQSAKFEFCQIILVKCWILPSFVGLLCSSKTSVQMMFSFLLELLISEASEEEFEDEWPEVKLPFVWGILNDSYPQKHWCHTISEAVGRQVILEYSHHDEYAWASKGLRFTSSHALDDDHWSG